MILQFQIQSKENFILSPCLRHPPPTLDQAPTRPCQLKYHFPSFPQQSIQTFCDIMSKVVLIASDQGKFEVEEAVAKKSQLLKNMIEDTGVEEEIYLPNVKSTPLRKIIEFSEHYKTNDPPEIEKPLSKNSLKDLVDPWDEQFINLPNQEELLQLLLAANYLDIKSLIELCCAKVATMIKGKSAEEIRQQFGIVNDFTPEEEAQIREENKWAEECAN